MLNSSNPQYSIITSVCFAWASFLPRKSKNLIITVIWCFLITMKPYEEIAKHGQRNTHKPNALAQIPTNASAHTIKNYRNRKAIATERMLNQRWLVDMRGKRKAKERRMMVWKGWRSWEAWKRKCKSLRKCASAYNVIVLSCPAVFC